MRHVCAHKPVAWPLYRGPTFFFGHFGDLSAWVYIVPTALSLADLWQRPCPLAEVSLKYDSEEADVRVGRRGQLCGGKHARGAILLPSPTCALTLRLCKKQAQNNQRLCLRRVSIGYPIHLARSKAASVTLCVVVRARFTVGAALWLIAIKRSVTEPVRPLSPGLGRGPESVTGA